MLKTDLVMLLKEVAEFDASERVLPDGLSGRVAAAARSGSSVSSIPDDIREFVSRYYDWLGENGGKKRYTNKEKKDAETTINRLVEIDCYDFSDEIIPALRWAVQDSFWSAQVRSLGQLRAKSKANGELKFTNLFAAYSASKVRLKSTPITRSEVIQDERSKRAEERLRERLAAESARQETGFKVAGYLE